MEENSKFISGLTSQKPRRKPAKYFSDSEKHIVINVYLSSDYTKKP